MQKINILLMVLGLVLGQFSVQAAPYMTQTTPDASATVNVSTTTMQKKALKNASAKFEQKIAKFKKKIQRWSAIDLTDDVQKWLWYGLICLAIAVALSIIGWIISFSGLIGLLSSIFGLAGTIFLVIWLIKFLG